jgi:hypothetical protein
MSRHILTPEDCRKGGAIGGKRNGEKESTKAALAAARTPEHQRSAGYASQHAQGRHKFPHLNCTRCFPIEVSTTTNSAVPDVAVEVAVPEDKPAS